MKKFIAILAVAFLVFAQAAYGSVAVQDDGAYEGDVTTINFSTGLSGSLSGSTYTVTGGAVGDDGNWTGDGTTVTLDLAPTKFIATGSSGDFYATQFTSDDYYGSTNGQNFDLSTNNAFKFVENSDTLTITASGDDFQVDSSDGGIQFVLTDASDGTVDFMTNNDTDDYIQISTTTNQSLINFVGQNGKITAASGTISFDDEALSTSGSATVGSVIIGDDTLDVVSDDILRFASNDSASTIEAYGYEAMDGVLRACADEGDDNGDCFQFVADTTDSLFLQNDTSGSDATILTVASTGAITTTNDIDVVNDTSTTNAVQDVLTVRSSTTGTPAAGLGVGIEFDVEDAGGVEQQGSIDVALTTETDSAEDADMIFSINTAGSVAEVLRLVAASSATTGDSVTITQNTTETDAIVDILSLANVTGTAANNTGLGITWDFEDAGGAEEQASLDVQLTDATDAAEDAAIIFSQQTAGAVAETMRIQGASSATTGDYLKITQNTSETDGVLDALVLTNVTGTAAAGAGIGISFEPEDAGGAEQQGSIDVVLTTATNASEDADFVFSQNTAGAIAETLRLVAASSATTSDSLQYTANTTETDAVTDILVLKTATGTATDNYGIGISFQPEDATGSEEVASLDIVETTAARATNDTDFVFSQNVNGTITERVRFDADGSNIVLSGATPAITIGDAGEEDTQVNFDGNAADFSIGVDDTNDSLSLSLGTALGTTEILRSDGTTLTITDAVVISTAPLTLPQAADCSSYTGEGQLCWDTDDDDLSIGDGAAALTVSFD